MKKRSWGDFIVEAFYVQKGRYRYEPTPDVRASKKVKVDCPLHGGFTQPVGTHMAGKGCKKCANDLLSRRRAKTTAQIVREFHRVHGGKFDYSKVIYKHGEDSVTIVCPVHGKFKQTPATHLASPTGCPECSKLAVSAGQTFSTAEAVEKFKLVHGDRYDYSEVLYVNNHTPVSIICKKHGEFAQLPAGHFTGKGCPECGGEAGGEKRAMSAGARVLGRFRNTHGDLYDYTEVVYKAAKKRVKIVCKKHGVFLQYPYSHIAGHGCPKCGVDKRAASQAVSKESFLVRASNVHGNAYTYKDAGRYTGRAYMDIECKLHGQFQQTVEAHLNGSGCPECGVIRRSLAQQSALSDVIMKFEDVHGNRYDYSAVEYQGSHRGVKITCKEHGEFRQTPSNHLAGKGCPRCGYNISKAEDEIGNFLSGLGLEVMRNDRKLVKPKEIDIYLPEKSLAVEYNGVLWHSEKFKTSDGKVNKARRYHIDKTALCAESGVRLIHVNSNEDMTTVKRTLAVITGADQEKIFARKCRVEKINKDDYDSVDGFLNKYHIQGAVPHSKLTYTLTYNGQMVAVMVFSKVTSIRAKVGATVYELRRYSSVCRIVGGASKLLKAFTRDNPLATEVISYSENRWFTGGMYEAIGFCKVSTSRPDYSYVNTNGKVFHKSKFTHARMKMMGKFSYDPEDTERENTWRNKYYRLWDCGKTKWSLKIKA